MHKILVVLPELCTGCRICELVCSEHNTGAFSVTRSRVKVIKQEGERPNIPILCSQCEDPPCVAACPTHALYKDWEDGIVKLDLNKCIGCKMCFLFCPSGAISIDPNTLLPIKCDLCGGDPECVKACPTGALDFIRVDRATLKKRRISVERLSGLTVVGIKRL